MSWVLLSALIVGLLGSGHCLGMCGGIAAAFTPTLDGANTPQRSLHFALLYNLGRICSYVIAGALAGAFGLLLGNQLDIPLWSAALRLASGLLIAAIGLSLLLRWNLLPRLERIGGGLWQHLAPLSTRLRPLNRPHRWLLLGMLWGWLPCGMVYSMLLVALMAGDALHGALVMCFFALGTLPSMLLAGVTLARCSVWLQRHHIGRRTLRGTAGATCLLLGVWTMLAPALPMPEMPQHPLSTTAAVCRNPGSTESTGYSSGLSESSEILFTGFPRSRE